MHGDDSRVSSAYRYTFCRRVVYLHRYNSVILLQTYRIPLLLTVRVPSHWWQEYINQCVQLREYRKVLFTS